MKKVNIALLSLLLFLLAGCGTKTTDDRYEFNITEQQLRSICEFSTLKCYFNNVAKITKEGSFLTKDSEMWIEYSGIVDMGVDFSKVTLEPDGDKLIITIPDAKIIGKPEADLDDASYYFTKSGIFSKKLTADDEVEAFRQAQEDMRTKANENESLMMAAKNRAKALITTFVNQMDELAGTSHTIVWKDA